jgi:cytochrome c biogenesis protein CcmG/thiol:disulfide interchange protein DsbE
MRRLAYLLPALLFALVAGYFLLGLGEGRDPSRVPSAMIDRPMPAFALPGIADGDPGLDSGALAGKVAVVNFFASWCLPCRVEHPLLAGLAAKGVPVYGILYKDKPGAALAWLAELGNPYAASGADPEGRTAIEFGVYGVPETYLIDREGRIRFKQVGPLDEPTIERTLLPMIEELRR